MGDALSFGFRCSGDNIDAALQDGSEDHSLSGGLFILGYGTSAEEMIAAGRVRIMYRVR